MDKIIITKSSEKDQAEMKQQYYHHLPDFLKLVAMDVQMDMANKIHYCSVIITHKNAEAVATQIERSTKLQEILEDKIAKLGDKYERIVAIDDHPAAGHEPYQEMELYKEILNYLKTGVCE